MGSLDRHLFHHWRFYIAALVGVVVYAVMFRTHGPLQTAAAGDMFCLVYLAGGVSLLTRWTHHDLKHRAATEDDGIAVVIALAVLLAIINIATVFVAINHRQHLGAWSLVLALAAAPLSWFMLHTISAFHYANLHYSEKRGGVGYCLEFPGTEEPGPWDFVYFSFVIGMTAQVSDVQVRTVRMRRVVTGHSIVSFFFNTVLIAVAVNMAVALAA